MSNTGSDRLANAGTNRGLNQHLRSCYLKNKITDIQILYERKKGEGNDQTSDDSNKEIPDTSTSITSI